MSAVDRVLGTLEGVRPCGNGWEALCPAHDDRKPSLGVDVGDDGRVLIHCRAGCEFEAILSALALTSADLFENGSPTQSHIVEAYDYTDEDGNLLFQAVRKWPKGFFQRRPDGHDGWISNLNGVKRVLYHLPQLRTVVEAGEDVYVAEGEKDVHTLEGRGVAATCNPGGAGKWRHEYSEELKGVKVIIVQDRDKNGAGQKHARTVYNSVRKYAASVRIVEAAAGNDATDHFAAGYGLDDFVEVMPSPEDDTGAASLRQRRVVLLSDLYKSKALLEPMQYDLRPYTAKGMLSLLSAPPKIGKSTFATAYVNAKTTGSAFLDQPLTKGRVLVVPLDENTIAAARRYLSFGTPGGMVQFWTDPDVSIKEIAEAAERFEAELIVLDTLSRVARITDENDNAAWIRFFSENDQYIRNSNAAWLSIHHDRKSGGSDGAGIRGASAIFGCVDIAFSLRRNEDSRSQRVLRMEGTRFDQAEDLVIEFDSEAHEYKALGDLRIVRVLADDKLMALKGCLTSEHEKVGKIEALAKKAGVEVGHSSIYKLLDKLYHAGMASKEGEGGHSDPYRFALVTDSTPRGSDNETTSGELSEAPPERPDKTAQAIDSQSDTLSHLLVTDFNNDLFAGAEAV